MDNLERINRLIAEHETLLRGIRTAELQGEPPEEITRLRGMAQRQLQSLDRLTREVEYQANLLAGIPHAPVIMEDYVIRGRS